MRSSLSFCLVAAGIVCSCASGGSAVDSPGAGGDPPDSGSPDVPVVDSGPSGPAADAATCVHNTDCQSSTLCSPTGGFACMGGFCVPTGKPMSCDDGVPCTDDSCDAATNMCVHTPTDSNCPAGEYCDSTLNCVQTLPCMAGDSVCDRLTMGACDPW